MANAAPPTAPPMTAFFEVDEVTAVTEVVFPEPEGDAEAILVAVKAPAAVATVVDVGRDAEGETWFGQTVKVLLLFIACCSTA
jgi:hypothetical protein